MVPQRRFPQLCTGPLALSPLQQGHRKVGPVNRNIAFSDHQLLECSHRVVEFSQFQGNNSSCIQKGVSGWVFLQRTLDQGSGLIEILTRQG